jgi:hypothetical protein
MYLLNPKHGGEFEINIVVFNMQFSTFHLSAIIQIYRVSNFLAVTEVVRKSSMLNVAHLSP